MACCRISGQIVTLVVSFSILVFYMMLGAFMFTAIELPHESKGHNLSLARLQKMTSSSSKAIQKLTDRFNSSACESLEAIEFFKNRNNATPHDEDEEFSWTYTKSMMFAFATITTIGYGDSIPTTHVGKGIAILFALICIPLYYMMVMLYARHGLTITKTLIETCTSDTRKAFLILNAVLFGVLFIAIMFFTSVYCFTKKADFGNSLWYTFATFTTIGFGDHVPDNAHSGHAFYFIVFVTLVHILIGMIVLSWKSSFLKLHSTVERYSSTVFGLCCHVSLNSSLRVEVGMTRLPEEPVDAEMEAVQFDPNDNEDEDVFNEGHRVAT